MLPFLSILLLLVIICTMLLALFQVRAYFASVEHAIRVQTEIIRKQNEYLRVQTETPAFDKTLAETFLSLHAEDEIALTLVNGEVVYINGRDWTIDGNKIVCTPEKTDDTCHQTFVDLYSITSYDVARHFNRVNA